MTGRVGSDQATATGTAIASLAVSFTTPVWPGDMVLTAGGMGNGRTISTVADNQTGNTYTQISAPTVQNQTRAYMYASYNVASTGASTFTVTWTFSGSGAGAVNGIHVSNGVTSAGADPATTTGGGVTAGTSASATVAQTTYDNVQYMVAFSAAASITFTNTSPVTSNVSRTNNSLGFTAIANVTGVSIAAYQRGGTGVDGDGTVASTWTASATSSASTDFVIVACSFKTIPGGSLVWYFHADTPAANSPPATPANCSTISQIAPDLADNVSPSNTGGHTGASGTLPQLVLCKPAAKDNLAQVAGSTPPSTVPPISAQQFGWWSDIRLQGYIPSNSRVQITLREDDTVSGLTGNAILNFYASSTRDFTGIFRYLGSASETADWWTGTTANLTGAASIGASNWLLQNEYLFVQVWCNETSGASAGSTHTFHQEGSNVAPVWNQSRFQFQIIQSVVPLARNWFNAPQSMRQLLAR